MCAHVCIDTLHMYAYVDEKHRSMCLPQSLVTLLFETRPLTEPTDSARLASQQAPGIFLSPALQLWHYTHTLLSPTFMWVLKG